MTTYYVSNTATNGINVGSDSSDGSQTTPFLTLDKALAVATDGDTIYINNGTYSSAGGTFDITKAVDIQSVVDGGATLVGTGGQSPINIDVTSGGTVTLGAINIDAQNSANAIALQSESRVYTLDMEGTHLLNATGYAVAGEGSTHANITANNVTFAADVSQGMIGLPSLATGNVNIEGGTVTIADQLDGTIVSGSGQNGSSAIALIDATAAAGVSVHVSGVTANTTTDALDSVAAGLTIMNIANAIVENNNITVAGSSATARDIEISYDLAAPLDSSGAIVRNNTLQNFNAGGGILVMVGSDGSPGQAMWGMASNAQIYGNVGTGDAASQSADLHFAIDG